MTDRDKVIKGLELCEFGSDKPCYEQECPYYQKGCTEVLQADILTTMKEQEPVEPWTRIDIKPYGSAMIFRCGACHTELARVHGGASLECVHANIKYCFRCGRTVKWDE